MFDDLPELLAASSRITWHDGHATPDEWIERAQTDLGFDFPPSYAWWLRTYGNGFVDCAEILSLAPPEFRGDADSDIVTAHALDRRGGLTPTDRLYVLRPSLDEAFYFDLNVRSPSGELAVWREDRLGSRPERFADDFADFLRRMA